MTYALLFLALVPARAGSCFAQRVSASFGHSDFGLRQTGVPYYFGLVCVARVPLVLPQWLLLLSAT